MKRRTLTFFILIFVLSISSCRKWRYVSFDAMQPAQITFPSDVNKLLIINRTKFEKQKTLSIIEGVLSGEMPGEDKSDVQELMTSLQQTLVMSPRFLVKMATEVLGGNSLTAAFPEPLSWDTIEYFCKKYDVDAIIAIEQFDTDFIVTNGKRKTKKKTEGGTEIEAEEYYAEGLGKVKVGFKLYDPKGKTIVDQQLFTTTNTWQGVGTSPTDAALKLIAKTQATKYVSRTAGSNYAYKIAPMPIRIKRPFYRNGGVPEIAAGRRLADVNEWKAAVDKWESGLQRANGKTAGRLCFNIAVGYEVLGNMEKAKEWASRSYVDYRNKKALNYSQQLNQKTINDGKVKMQMK